jgi:hypothetical protein
MRSAKTEAAGEGRAAIALGAVGALAPRDEGADLSFSRVVCGLDVVVRDEGPERLLVLKDVGA